MNSFRARAWALAGVVALVSACGGGGGDSGGSGNPPPAPPPPAPEEFLVAGFGPEGQGTTRLVVVDPAQPTPPRLSTLVDQYLEVSPLTFDANGRRITLGHETMVYYVRQGLLYQVNLRKSQSPVPRRISALATACSVDDWHPFSFNSGDDGWLEVTASGADANCFDAADNRKVFVRHNAATTENPSTLPDGVRVLSALPDPATHALLGFIAADNRTSPSKLSLYTPTLSYVGDVAGSTGRSALEIVSLRPGGPLRTSAYVKTNGLLGRLDWSASSATLTSYFHSFSSTASDDEAVAHSDDSALYFLDGLSLHRLGSTGGISTLATLNAADGTEVVLRGLTSGHVVVQQGTNGAGHVFAVPKLGGTPLRLAPAQGTKYVVGLNGDDVIYSTYPGFGTRVLRRIGVDGSNDQLIAAPSSGFPMPVSNPTVSHQSIGALDAVMWCEVPGGQGSCTNGAIRSYDVQSRTTVTLGTLSHSGSTLASGLYMSGSGFSGRPTLIRATAAPITGPGFVNEFYLVQPGTANSLVRVTNNIP